MTEAQKREHEERLMKTIRGRLMAAKRSNFRKGRAIDVIFIALVLFGLGYGVYWIIKAGGQATEEYGTGMVNTQNKSMTLACQMNMRSVWQTLQVAAASDWKYPESMADLKRQSGDSRIFHCPDPNGSDYVYLPPKRMDSGTPTIILYEPTPTHNGKCNILLSTGELTQMPLEELRQHVPLPEKP
jgi:hypothetical protein